MRLTRRLLFFPVLLLGIIILLVAVMFHHSPSISDSSRATILVSTIELMPQNIAPEAVGYGYLYPKFEWRGIAEVAGKVVYRHPKLEKGQWLTKGTQLLRIDPTDTLLQMNQVNAQLASAKSALVKLTKQHSYLKTVLKIEQNRLELANKELHRKENLRNKGLTAQTDVDQQRLQSLIQRKVVEDIQYQLAVFPQDIEVSQAQIAADEAKVKEVQTQLARTILTLPEDSYIDDVLVELDQVVTLQQTLVSAHQVAMMNVEAQIPYYQYQQLMNSLNESVLTNSDAYHAFKCNIELKLSNRYETFICQVAQVIHSVDTERGTIGVLLDVPLHQKRQNLQVLLKGGFVKARLYGMAKPQWVVTENTLHGNQIYIKNQDDQLEMRTIAVQYRVDDRVVITGNIHAGEKLIVTDLLPAIEGMQVNDVSIPKQRDKP